MRESSATSIRRLVCRAVIILAMTLRCLAQRYTFQLYGQADGLSNLNVLSVLQDRPGFLWVGTQNGLFRYNGVRFQSFSAGQGLPGGEVTKIHESPGGTLFVASAALLPLPARFPANSSPAASV